MGLRGFYEGIVDARPDDAQGSQGRTGGGARMQLIHKISVCQGPR